MIKVLAFMRIDCCRSIALADINAAEIGISTLVEQSHYFAGRLGAIGLRICVSIEDFAGGLRRFVAVGVGLCGTRVWQKIYP